MSDQIKKPSTSSGGGYKPINQKKEKEKTKSLETTKERAIRQRLERMQFELSFTQDDYDRWERSRKKLAAQKTSFFDDAIDTVTGALKQVANDLVASQHAMLTEHLVDKGVFEATDTVTGEKLSADEVASRSLEQQFFDISDSESFGAKMIKEVPAYESAILVTETIATKGRNVVKSPDIVQDALKKSDLAKELREDSDIGAVIGVLKEANQLKGNKTLDGEFSREQIEQIGQAWVGENAVLASDGATLVSQDKLRQYRPPKAKPNSRFAKSGIQANLESRLEVTVKGTEGRHTKLTSGWQGNAHLNLKVDE